MLCEGPESYAAQPGISGTPMSDNSDVTAAHEPRLIYRTAVAIGRRGICVPHL
jgi:hypothetical protein